MELTNAKTKVTRDLRRAVSEHILGPAGMTQLAVHLHERLIAPGVLRTGIWSFVKNGEDLAQFKTVIEEIITALKSFQAYPPDVEETDGGNSAGPALHALLEIYTRKGSIFSRYALHSVPLLHPITYFILAAANLEKDRFAHKKILCSVRATWDKYESLGVSERLNAVKVFAWGTHRISLHDELSPHRHTPTRNCTLKSCPENVTYRDISGDIFLTENNNYQPHGYGKTRRSQFLDVYHALDHCSFKESEHFSNWLDQTKPSHQGFICIIDDKNKNGIVTYEKEGQYKLSPTVRDYLGALRQLTEATFRNKVNSLDPIKSHLGDCHTSPAGSIEVTVVRAELSLEKGAYDKNQNGDDFQVLPDPYVRILVDDVEVGRTSVKNNTLTPQWVETFYVDKVYSWSDVQLEVYDRDGDEGDKDDNLGGVGLELVNIIGGLKQTFFSRRDDFAFGRITVGIKYTPHSSHN